MDRLLIVERQASRRLILRRLAESAGFEADASSTLDGAAEALPAYRAVILEAALWETTSELLEGSDLLVVLSGDGSPEFAGPRIPRSADVKSLRRALRAEAALGGEDGGLDPADDAPAASGFLTRDPTCQGMLEEVRRLADSTVSVLVQGESGTGKELIARALHEQGPRRADPFVAVNCSAIPPTLLESEIFGHERGAFTDAVRRHRGCFERAGDGTLFLDEIGDLPLSLQPKLLRVLEARVFTRVGGEEDIPARARVVAATHRDLLAEMDGGNFRPDLYHRLTVARVWIPPLRERPKDLEWLTQLWLTRLAHEYGQDPRPLSPESWRRMRAHPWPGNVRELENLLRRALLLHPEGEVVLAPEALTGEVRPAWFDSLSAAIREQLARGGNFEEVARGVRQAVEELLSARRPMRGDHTEEFEEKE